MTIVRYNPTGMTTLGPIGRSASPWTSFEREFDRLFSTALSDMAASTAADGLDGFAADLFEDADNHYLRAELPGVDRKNINVEMVEGYLTVSGERGLPGGNGKEGERVEFSRSMSIPDAVQADKVSAALENGILTVTMPKREEAKPRKISIQVK